MYKSIITFVVGILLIAPALANAQVVVFPNRGGTGTSTIPSYDSILIGNASGTYDLKTLVAGSNVTISTSSNLITISASGGGGGGGGSISTSSIPVAGNLSYWTSAFALSDVATGTLTETITGASFSATRGLVGGSSILSLDAGYSLASTSDFLRINAAFSSSTALNATSPLTYTGTTGNFSIASGFVVPSTTPWSDINNFYNIPSSRITAGTGIDWSGNTLNGVYTAGVGLTLNTEDFVCDTASGSVFGCITAADWTSFNGRVSSTSIDTSSELAALITDETGTGNLVFSASPIFTGTPTFQNIFMTTTGTSTLGYASTTALTVAGNAFLNGFTATNATITNATSTTLFATNASGSNMFGFGLTACSGASNKITYSAGKFLCEADQTGGGGGGVSDWQRNAANDAIRPTTTTLGIVVTASSSISDLSVNFGTITNATSTTMRVSSSFFMGSDVFTDLTGFGLANSSGALGLNTTGAADGECLTYVAAGPTIDWATCGGAGGSKWTDSGVFTYLTASTDDLAIGSTATATAPFWWDVSATTSYIGNGGAGDSVITFGPVGTEWTMGFDDTNDSFKISSSTALGTFDFLSLTSTTSILVSSSTLVETTHGGRFMFNTDGYYGLAQALDNFVFEGRIRNNDWYEESCYAVYSQTQIAADGVLPYCPRWWFAEDGTETLTGVASNGFVYSQLGGAVASGGAMVTINGPAASNWMRLATNTPSFEVTARIGTIAAMSSTTSYYIGFTSQVNNAANMELTPSSGCYFIASTTANWYAGCSNGAANRTFVDTGIASTSITTGAGDWKVFRIDADGNSAKFYIKNGTSSMQMVANITNNIPGTVALAPMIMFGRTTGAQAVQFDFYNLNLWMRKLVANGS